MKNKIKQIKRIANENPGGFTIRTTDLSPVKKGWVVAMKRTQGSFGDEGLEKAFKVAEETTQTFGGWKDGKKFYWDAVMIFDNEDQATEAGKEHDQIAIYQIETNKLKYI